MKKEIFFLPTIAAIVWGLIFIFLFKLSLVISIILAVTISIYLFIFFIGPISISSNDEDILRAPTG